MTRLQLVVAGSDGTVGGPGGTPLVSTAARERGPWVAATTYHVSDIVTYGNTTWLCAVQHISATTFDETKFTEVNSYRGAWQPTTRYKVGDTVARAGELWQANSSFTSTGSFDATKFDMIVGGIPGPAGPPGVGANWRGVWAIGTTYVVGDGVAGSNGQFYISNVAGNVGHDPTTDDGTHWGALPTGNITTANSGAAAVIGVRSPGGIVDVDVQALSGITDPATVTDWGAHLNTALTAGARSFLFRDGIDYPFTTQPAIAGLTGVRLIGENGVTWVRDAMSHEYATPRLIWKNAGTDSFLDRSGTIGLQLRDLAICYDNPGFTGRLLSSLDTGLANTGECFRGQFERVTFGSKDHSIASALALVSLEHAVCDLFSECVFADAQHHIIGVEYPWPDHFSTAHNFRGCTFGYASVAQILNIGTIGWGWLFDGCTFELNTNAGNTPRILDSDPAITDLGSQFTFSACRLGDDWNGRTTPLFNQRPNNNWTRATWRDCDFAASGTDFAEFNCLGPGGTIAIDDNQLYGMIVIADFGDAYADGSIKKHNIRVRGNDGIASGLVSDQVLNDGGHQNLDISHNGGLYIAERTSYSGTRRQRYGSIDVGPTIAPAAGVTLNGLSISGTDGAMLLLIQAEGAGQPAGPLAVVTFHTPRHNDPSGLGGVLTGCITPTAPDGLWADGAAAAAAGLGITNVHSGFGGTPITEFTICCTNPLANWQTIRFTITDVTVI